MLLKTAIVVMPVKWTRIVKQTLCFCTFVLEKKTAKFYHLPILLTDLLRQYIAILYSHLQVWLPCLKKQEYTRVSYCLYMVSFTYVSSVWIKQNRSSVCIPVPHNQQYCFQKSNFMFIDMFCKNCGDKIVRYGAPIFHECLTFSRKFTKDT